MGKLIVILALTLQGCAAYNAYSVANIAAGATTGKTITDHTLSAVTQHDCSTYQLLTSKQDYYCERPRDAATTYNRSSF